MKLFYSKTENFESNTDKETILKILKQKGAIVHTDSFRFFGNFSSVSGYVETINDKTIIYLKSEMGVGVQIFCFIWILGTLAGFIHGIYKIFLEKSFDCLPFISLGLLIFGILILTLFSSDQSMEITNDIKKYLRLR